MEEMELLGMVKNLSSELLSAKESIKGCNTDTAFWRDKYYTVLEENTVLKNAAPVSKVDAQWLSRVYQNLSRYGCLSFLENLYDLAYFSKTPSMANQKIECIKVLRNASGMGLKESKDEVDLVWQQFMHYTGNVTFGEPTAPAPENNPQMCAADCGCSGGQPSLTCDFSPYCTRCFAAPAPENNPFLGGEDK